MRMTPEREAELWDIRSTDEFKLLPDWVKNWFGEALEGLASLRKERDGAVRALDDLQTEAFKQRFRAEKAEARVVVLDGIIEHKIWDAPNAMRERAEKAEAEVKRLNASGFGCCASCDGHSCEDGLR